ncbi:MAG: hypothetical protein ACYDEY_08390 [Acidimicrobiales bacterium]
MADCVEVGLFIDTDIGSLAHVATDRAVEGRYHGLAKNTLMSTRSCSSRQRAISLP